MRRASSNIPPVVEPITSPLGEKSPPAQNARPAPVITATRTSRSAWMSRLSVASSRCMVALTEFNRSGRLSVHTATPSSRLSMAIVWYAAGSSMPRPYAPEPTARSGAGTAAAVPPSTATRPDGTVGRVRPSWYGRHAMSISDPSARRRPAGRPRKAATGPAEHPRLQIVAAATRLFAVNGIGPTTMAEIAEAAGLGASSLYYWFGSKQQILEVIVTDVNRLPLRYAEQALHEPGPAAPRLWRLVRFDVLTLCGFPFDINEVHRLAGQDHATFARYWQERQQLNDAVERLIESGISSGEFRPVDARLAALTLLANNEAVQNWFRPVAGHRLAGRSTAAGGDYTPDEVASFLAEQTLRTLLREPAGIGAVVDAANAAETASADGADGTDGTDGTVGTHDTDRTDRTDRTDGTAPDG